MELPFTLFWGIFGLSFRNIFACFFGLVVLFASQLFWTSSRFCMADFLPVSSSFVDGVALLLIYLTFFVLITSFISHTFSFPLWPTFFVFSTIFFACVCVFSFNTLLPLYVTFELSLVPILFAILNWGSYSERGVSSLSMLLFTSVFTLPLGVFILGPLNVWASHFIFASLNCPPLPLFVVIWVVLSFSVKLPVFGLHFWLPMAHVEAPTFGSIILAGLLLKIGGCGLIRCLPLLSQEALDTLREVLSVYLLTALVLSSLLCLAQSDFKRLVAYSSVVHISVVLSLICAPSPLSISVLLSLLVTHGLSSPLLFFVVGLVYSIFSTRELSFIRGLLKLSVGLSFFATLTFLINIPVPPLFSFFAEVVSFIALWNLSFLLPLIAFFVLGLALIYSLMWFSSVSFGPLPPVASVNPILMARTGLVLSSYPLLSFGLLFLANFF